MWPYSLLILSKPVLRQFFSLQPLRGALRATYYLHGDRQATRRLYLFSLAILLWIHLVGGAELLLIPVIALVFGTGAAVILLYNYLSVRGLVLVCGVSSFTVAVLSCYSSMQLSGSWASVVYCFGNFGYLSNNTPLHLSFICDHYNIWYGALTSCIGSAAIWYAYVYMCDEHVIGRFVLLLYSFLYSMLLLLYSYNVVTFFLGWELIGCFSFLLINFWTVRVGTAKSAFKAFTFNKISDASLLSVLVILLSLNQPTALNNLDSLMFVVLCPTLGTIVLVLLIICAFCKSAQFGFHIWLPDSMEAPVPASALIHSATLVSAGIYLLGRVSNAIFFLGLHDLLFYWASFTALYGGVVAAYQSDLKRVLAYSTISHCGFLFVLVALNNVWVLVLYLHLHGWFKSFSFMLAGSVITSSNGCQDFRRMGSMGPVNTAELYLLLISLGCLGGLPFTLGFFNKHYLLLVLSWTNPMSFPIIMVQAAAFTGVIYYVRLVSGVFYGIRKGHHSTYILSGGCDFEYQLIGLPVILSWVYILLPIYSVMFSVYLVWAEMSAGVSVTHTYGLHNVNDFQGSFLSAYTLPAGTVDYTFIFYWTYLMVTLLYFLYKQKCFGKLSYIISMYLGVRLAYTI